MLVSILILSDLNYNLNLCTPKYYKFFKSLPFSYSIIICKMVVHHNVEGFEEFDKLIKELEEKDKPIFILFCGSKASNGKSWCPDCVTAEPLIEKVITTLDDNKYFVHVGVGGRDTWKDPNCVFRKDSRLLLTSVPTLLRWGGTERLGDKECADLETLKLLLESS